MKQHYLEANGRKIYVEEHFPENTDRPVTTVIFSHGFNSCYEEFHRHCEVMTEHGFGAVCYDFCGGSTRSKSSMETKEMSVLTEKEDLRAVLEYTRKHPKVDVARVFLFGASMGGMVSALLAEEEAEKIAGLMLLFPAFCIPDDWRGKVPEGEEAPETFDLWGVTLGKCYYEAVKDWDIYKTVGTFPKRTMIWHGTLDSVVAVDYGRKMSGVYPMAAYKEFPEEGHGFSEEGNEEVIQDVLSFIREKEVLTVHVKVTEVHSVEQDGIKICMVGFHGTAEGCGFQGKVLPGGVDTQMFTEKEATLSARYMIAGTDENGEKCSIYVENQGAFPAYGAILTNAMICTDCKALQGIRQPLYGWIEGVKDSETEDLKIHLYEQ